jgi:hypothetical protein
MTWYNDPLFAPPISGKAHNRFTPSFRLSIMTPWQDLDPNEKSGELQALFDCFTPVLKRDCTRMVMEKRNGFKQIMREPKPADWKPFEVMAASKKPGSGNFMFQSDGTGPGYAEACGASLARFTYSSEIRFDLHIPVVDFEAGALDMDRVKACLGNIPHRTSTLGYGLALAERTSADLAAQEQIALRYLALDVMKPTTYVWRGPYHDLPEAHWLRGVNWITGIGEPFLSMLGGHTAIMNDLPDAITGWESAAGTSFFQCGAKPVPGRLDEDSAALDLYLAVGERLAPPPDGYPSTRYRPNTIWSDASNPDSLDLAWHRRFYDGAGSAWMERARDA